ncbi:protein FAM171B-like [Engraulis encrasicolus]|uniref:protein FAM171B-like n=1 Tax=Engraulis encrasicolus TaxID=184585 RepID=UPI002FD39C32
MSEFFYLLLATLLISSEDGLRGVDGALAVTNRDGDNFVQGDAQQSPTSIRYQFLKTDVTESASVFLLRVHVKDAASRQRLTGVTVELFVNYKQAGSPMLTGEDGSALLRVPYQPQQSITLVASRTGYMLTPLPWKASKMPTFLSMTMSLVSQTRGNIWMFEDSVLITGKVSESLPNVMFPRSLLSVPECNVSTITAYLTVPLPSAEKSIFYNTMGVLNSKSGHRSIELKPVAAVGVELSCNREPLQVKGPIHITLPVPENTGLTVSQPLPAWSFDKATGAWLNQGLGIVKKQDDVLVWSFVAPQLGLWIAAPYAASTGKATHLEFYQHAYLLLAILSGTIIILSGMVIVLMCRCRSSSRMPAAKRSKSIQMETFKRDQNTSTNSMYQQGATQKAKVSRSKSKTHSKGRKHNHYVDSHYLPPSVQLYRNAMQQTSNTSCPPNYNSAPQTAWPEEGADQNTVPGALNEKSLFSERIVHVYNQPLGVLQAADLSVSANYPSGSTCATSLPRQAAGDGAQSKTLGRDSYTQTLPETVSPPSASQGERGQGQGQGQGSSGSQGPSSGARTWGRFNTLLESVSVPGTLSEAAAAGMSPLGGGSEQQQGASEQDLRGVSKKQPLPHARAWFVSLEGRPVTQVRHSIMNLQRCLQRASERNTSSLDSGVDMNEHMAASAGGGGGGGGAGGGGGVGGGVVDGGRVGRRLERERTFIRSSAHSSRTQRLCSDDMDPPSSSESATTATCTPEDASLRSILDSSSSGGVVGGGGAVMPRDIPEERDDGEDGGDDTSSAQEDSEARSTPSPRRVRRDRDRDRDRDKSRAERPRSTWHMREERPLMKLN